MAKAADPLESALHTPECIERMGDGLRLCNSTCCQHRNNPDGILDHMVADNLQLALTLEHIILHDPKAHPGIRAVNILGPPGRSFIPLHAIPNRYEAGLLDNALNVGAGCAAEKSTIGWQLGKQLSEGLEVVANRGIDIEVVMLTAGQEHRLGVVKGEFGCQLTKLCWIFIPFEDKQI